MDYSGALETDDVLLQAGIDPEAMGYLTGIERREILIRAGLNLRRVKTEAWTEAPERVY